VASRDRRRSRARAANRANATIYTIDPRGLVAGPDLDQPVGVVEWQNNITTTQSSLQVLADLTGGFATVNRNDITPSLKRIDAETSDYYVLGYYSSNPDPAMRRRRIEIKVKRQGAEVKARTEYYLPGR
jgi:VWFA-related protein